MKERIRLLLKISTVLLLLPVTAFGQNYIPDPPSGYQQVGNTMLFYRNSETMDMQGLFGTTYYRSTYSDGGYVTAMKVNDNSAVLCNFYSGTSSYGVQFHGEVVPQGELARVVYTFTNTNETEVTLSAGVHADVMIGSNDHAPIIRRIDTNGATYGLTMLNGDGAQLCVLFGAGLTGVTSVNDFWFGFWNLNSDYSQIVGGYVEGSYYMQENGTYDSGMGWCWKNRVIPAGETITLSYLIGVGEVNLEPNSSFAVTPDDLEGWNDLTLPHQLTLEGTYESPAGLSGMIEYSVEDSEEWLALTEMLESGDSFEATLIANFDPSKEVHVINFRTRDNVGNATMLAPIKYVDVRFTELSGIEDKVFTGEAQIQENVTCDLEEEQYRLDFYQNNINAGMASFNLEGVFPYTIGRKTYTFEIAPQPLAGDLWMAETSFVYDGYPKTPEWGFTNEAYAELVENSDFTATWADNSFPGYGSLTVTGINNYTGSLVASIFIDKAPLTSGLYYIMIPNDDVLYDSESHEAYVDVVEGAGASHVYYYMGEGEAFAPITEPGTYDVYVEIDEGELYHGLANQYVGSYTIYQFDPSEWALIEAIYNQFAENGYTLWDMSKGVLGVGGFYGLNIREGHLTGIYLNNQQIGGQLPAEIFGFSQLEELDISGNRFEGDLTTLVNPETVGCAGSLKVMRGGSNEFTGNLGAFAQLFPSLTTLDFGHNHISEIYPAIPLRITDFNPLFQTIKEARVVDLRNGFNAEALMAALPSIMLYNHYEQQYGVDKYWSLVDGLEEVSCGLSIWYGNAEDFYISPQYTPNVLKKTSEDTLYLSDNETLCRCPIQILFKEGDANFSGGIDVYDLQSTIKYIFGGSFSPLPFNFTAANLFKDEVVNVQDIVLLVDLLLSQEVPQGVEPTAAAPRRLLAGADKPEAELFWHNGDLHLRSKKAIASLQLSIETTGDLEWRLDNKWIHSEATTAQGMNAVVYSLSGAKLAAETDVIIAHSTRGAEVGSALLSDEDAQPVSVSIRRSTEIETDIDEIEAADEIAQFVLFDLSGKQLMWGSREEVNHKLQSIHGGVYLIRALNQDGRVVKTEKVVLN